MLNSIPKSNVLEKFSRIFFILQISLKRAIIKLKSSKVVSIGTLITELKKEHLEPASIVLEYLDPRTVDVFYIRVNTVWEYMVDSPSKM